MLTAECPECEGKITFPKQPDLGHRFNCQHCDADIEVVWLDPLSLDWAFDEDFDEDYEEDYDYDYDVDSDY